MRTEKEKSALTTPTRHENHDTGKSTPSPRTRNRYADGILNELSSEVFLLSRAIGPARSGTPSDVTEVIRLCRIIRRYGELIDARLDAWLNEDPKEQAALLRLRDAADKPGGDA
jgi:hypothetical protein